MKCKILKKKKKKRKEKKSNPFKEGIIKCQVPSKSAGIIIHYLGEFIKLVKTKRTHRIDALIDKKIFKFTYIRNIKFLHQLIVGENLENSNINKKVQYKFMHYKKSY